MNSHTVPLIVVLTPNTLSSVGLRDMLSKILPFAVVKVCDRVEELREIAPTDIFHIFVSSQILIENIQLFDSMRSKTIALTGSTPNASMVQGYHQINIQQSEKQIIAAVQLLHSHAHGASHKPNDSASQSEELLTPREIEVTKLLVEGLINKEIASRLDISITTVITHRKNIFEKLGIRSIAGLTIYAIMKRYIEI